ncbi:MAG TPA: M23 family metallopeptidase [Vicinamibacterales bacterium]|nr:M23 family metallopeptidase [Vicinamibacterales bacterium]
MRVAFSLSFALAVLVHAIPGAQAPPFSVVVRGGPAQPGSVLEIRIQAPEGASDPQGTAFERPLAFAPGDEPRTWRALVGVDVAQLPGLATFRIDFATPAGRELATTGTITVAPRVFATRRLRVAGQFVDPPPVELARIRDEAERLEAIFGTVTIPDRIEAFVPPVPGVPGGNFGSRSVFNGEPRAPHAGVDFRGSTGTPIGAPGGGRVIMAEELFFTGQTVVIDHGLGLYSLLAHLSRTDVLPGARVVRGDIVGLLGATGRVTGPHLHWTVRLGGARVDPLRLVALLAPAHSGAAAERRSRPAAR